MTFWCKYQPVSLEAFSISRDNIPPDWNMITGVHSSYEFMMGFCGIRPTLYCKVESDTEPKIGDNLDNYEIVERYVQNQKKER